MKVRIRPSTPNDTAAIVELMRNAGLNPDAAERWLHWKYWQERSDWPGARSFVVANDSDIFAHSGIVPGTCLWNGLRATVIHMMDWAASPSLVGAGVALMKYIGGLADALIGVGGSRYTRQALPMVGFRPCGATTLYVRVLRPLLGLKDRVHWNWKTLPRIGRNVLSALSAPAARCGAWQAPGANHIRYGRSGDVARKSAWQFLNKVNDPKLGTLRRFAKAMGVRLEELVGGAGDGAAQG